MKLPPVKLEPVNRDKRNAAKPANAQGGVEPMFVCSILCGLLPEPLSTICKAGC